MFQLAHPKSWTNSKKMALDLKVSSAKPWDTKCVDRTTSSVKVLCLDNSSMEDSGMNPLSMKDFGVEVWNMVTLDMKTSESNSCATTNGRTTVKAGDVECPHFRKGAPGSKAWMDAVSL